MTILRSQYWMMFICIIIYGIYICLFYTLENEALQMQLNELSIYQKLIMILAQLTS